MFWNYAKLAIKVLGRNKFFTFVSLFGISFTLMILMVIVSFLDTEFGNHKPMSERDKMVFLDRSVMRLTIPDTIYEIDSSRIEGLMVYDSTMQIQDRTVSNSMSSAGYALLDRHLRDVSGVEDYTFLKNGTQYDIFLNNNQISLDVIFTDAGFWRIMDYEFLEGAGYQRNEVEYQQPVAVITDELCNLYFGTAKEVVGRNIEIDATNFKVIGVIRKPTMSVDFVSSDVYLPMTHAEPQELNDDSFFGEFVAIFQASTPANRKLIQDDILHKCTTIPIPDPENFNTLELRGKTFEDMYANFILQNDKEPQKSTKTLFLILCGLLLFFVLIPTLNLVNLNLSRILERSDEIGVRKSFGATSQNILFQFIFENVIMTLIGGLIGLAMALLLMQLLNSSQVIEPIVLTFNFKIFMFSVLVWILFGLISGVLPAYRISKLQIVKALKQQII